MVGSHEVASYSGALHFLRRNGLQGGPIALKMSQNIAKSMAYIITSRMVFSSRVVACLHGNFQQGGCLYKPTSGIQWTPDPSTRGRLTGLRNKPQKKQTCQHLAAVYWQLVSLLMELSIDVKSVL